MLFLKIGHPRPLFCLFSVLSNRITIFTTNKCEKWSGVRIRTHDHLIISLLTWPLDQGSCPKHYIVTCKALRCSTNFSGLTLRSTGNFKLGKPCIRASCFVKRRHAVGFGEGPRTLVNLVKVARYRLESRLKTSFLWCFLSRFRPNKWRTSFHFVRSHPPPPWANGWNKTSSYKWEEYRGQWVASTYGIKRLARALFYKENFQRWFAAQKLSTNQSK